MISIGGCVLLSAPVPVVGSVFFSLGLLTILGFQLSLYTGKIGFAGSMKDISTLATIYFGNMAGTFFVGNMMKLSHLPISDKASILLANKAYLLMDMPYMQIIIAGIFCGILMFVACYAYANVKNMIASTIIVILCVSVFILCGFEHCIADMFYIFAANECIASYGNQAAFIGLVTLGNTIGSIAFYRIMCFYELCAQFENTK